MDIFTGFVLGMALMLVVWLGCETTRCARSGFTGSCWCTCGKRKEPKR